MNVRTLSLWGIVALLSLLSACQNPTGPENQVTTVATHVNGTVLRNDNLVPIANAVVYDFGGLATDTSKSDGTFNLTYQLSSQIKTRIIGTRSGFGNDTSIVTLNPGIDTTIALRLKADSASPTGAVSSGKAANIVLISSSSDNVSIRGTGSNETALLLFEVRDSLGTPIAGTNKLQVNFSILGGPNGGEYVFPVSATTDPLTGRVTTRVNSGTKAGVLQVFASATVPGTPALSIKSSPVRITIAGGLPVADRFSLSRRPSNIAGGVYDNLRATIMVIVGDKEGNPVQEGTAVSFTTTGGIIQPNATTDKDGIASVDLISGNPRPTNSVAVVTAKTIGDSGVVIQKSISVLFSGPTRVLTPSSTVVIPDSGSSSFEYRVQDPNGFPLVSGTSISLSVDGPGSGNLELSGDVTRTMEDTNDPAATLFKATVRDKVLKGVSGAVTFKLVVTSPNGNSTVTFPGFVLADTGAAPPVITPGGTSKSGYISSLTLVNVDNSQISVRGTGASEISKLVFQARDSVGNTVDILKRAYVTFSISPVGGTGGGEFLFPAADSTDASGLVSTTLNAGTRAGVLQVIAQANQFGRVITSSPVRITISGGLPDAAHFTAKLTPQNMPGWTNDPVAVGNVTVQVGDKFGNPVQPGTALYFTTSGGLIQATATTDDAGHASAVLYGGSPYPSDNGNPGSGHVTVSTIGEGGAPVQQSIPFLFSGPASIKLLNVPNDTVKIFDGGSFDVNYQVSDNNGNPISGGTSVTVTASGLASSGVSLSGDIAVTTADTQDKNAQRYTFRVADAVSNGGPSGDVVFTISVGGVPIKRFYGILYSPQAGTIVPPSARNPAQIAFLGITNNDIYVSGVGNTENSVVTYEVRDSLGVPIDKLKRVYATFSINFTPNSNTGGGTPPRTIPPADSTDDSGKLRASIVSGTQAGTIQLVARVQLPGGGVIVSEPVKVTVHAGFPEQAHFTLMASSMVFAGYDYFSDVTFTTVVGDTFSNPVQAGTAIYYNSQAGVMHTGTADPLASYTDARGLATGHLWTVNPRPSAAPYEYIPAPTDPYYNQMGGGFPGSYGVPAGQHEGYNWVYSTTQGRGGVAVRDSILVCWSKAPIISFGIPAAVIGIPHGGTSTGIHIALTDANFNPLPDGTTVSVSLDYPTDVQGIKFGASGGFSSANATTFAVGGFRRFPGSGITDFTFSVSDLSTGGGAPVPMTVIVNIAITSPGIGSLTSSFTCVTQ